MVGQLPALLCILLWIRKHYIKTENGYIVKILKILDQPSDKFNRSWCVVKKEMLIS